MIPDFDVNLKVKVSGVWQELGGISVDGGNAYAGKMLVYGMNGATPTILQVGSDGSMITGPIARIAYASKIGNSGLVFGQPYAFPVMDALNYTRLVGDIVSAQPFTLYINQDEANPLDGSVIKQTVINSFRQNIVQTSLRNQIETITAAGSITGSGNLSVVVTATGVPGSPLTIPVGVTNGDSASTWAGKVLSTLGSNAAIYNFFAVSGSGTSIKFTAINPAANQSGMSIVVNAGTAANASLPITSADTQAGVDGLITYWEASWDVVLLKRYVQMQLDMADDPGGSFRLGAYLTSVVR